MSGEFVSSGKSLFIKTLTGCEGPCTHQGPGQTLAAGGELLRRSYLILILSLAKADKRAITVVALSPPVPFRLFFVRWISVGEEVPLPKPRLQPVHGTVPQECARKTLPARSDLLSRLAIEGPRCHPLPTSSTRAPEVTPN